MSKRLAFLCAVLSMPVLAQLPPNPQQLAQRLAAASERWREASIASYVYGFNKFCECHRETPPETLVTVEGSGIVDVRHVMAKTGDTVPASAENFSLYWTIDDLFALLTRAEQRGAAISADFDAATGVPQRIFIDYLPDVVGDEVDVRVTRFETR